MFLELMRSKINVKSTSQIMKYGQDVKILKTGIHNISYVKSKDRTPKEKNYVKNYASCSFTSSLVWFNPL